MLTAVSLLSDTLSSHGAQPGQTPGGAERRMWTVDMEFNRNVFTAESSSRIERDGECGIWG